MATFFFVQYTRRLFWIARLLIQTSGQRDEPPSKDIKAGRSATSRCELLIKRIYHIYRETRVCMCKELVGSRTVDEGAHGLLVIVVCSRGRFVRKRGIDRRQRGWCVTARKDKQTVDQVRGGKQSRAFIEKHISNHVYFTRDY